MAEVLLGQRSLLGFGAVLAWLLLFHLLVNIWLLCMFTSLLVVLGGWLGSQAFLESNSVIHLERFIALEQIPPSVEDEQHLDQEIHNTVRKIIRDFVSSWFSTVSTESAFESQVHEAMISTAMKLKLRARQVDRKKLTQRILELLGCHLQEYFKARDLEAQEQRSGAAVRRRPLWSTYAALTTPHVATTSHELEVNYIRAVVDVLLHVLVPPPHLETRTGRFVVGELITCNVLLPLVAKLSDPDWLNLLVIEIFGKSSNVHVALPAQLPTSPLDPPPAPPTGSEFTSLLQEMRARPPGSESPQKAEPQTPSGAGTQLSQLHEEVDSPHRSTGHESGRSFSGGNMGVIKSNPSSQQNDSDADSPPVDLKQSSTDSFVMIGQDEGLCEQRRDGVTPVVGHDGADMEDEPSPVDFLCPKVLLTVEMGEQAKLCGEAEIRDESSNRELLLGGHQPGSSNELTAVSPLQGCFSVGTFSFEPLSSPEGPVIIQNLRITGTITAKEHRGTGSHPYTLYTIKYETSVGGESSVQTSSEEAEVAATCLSPVQPVAYHTVNRRYSEFLNLQTRLEEKAELRKLSKGVKGPKKILPDMPFWNMDSDKIEARKGLLETFLKQLCAIPEIANSEEMQEFLALNTDARIAFVKKPFIVSRIDKIVVNAIVDTLKTAFPRSEPQSPTEDEAEVDGRLSWDKKSKSRMKSSGKNVPVLNGSDIKQPVVLSVDQTNSVFKGMSLRELQAAISEQEMISTQVAAESEEHGGPPRDTHRHATHPGSETELAEVALNVLCLLMKEQWSCMCTENIQKTIRLLFGTLINRWLDISVANLTSSRSWVSYLQLIQEAVWPGGTLPTEPAEERSNLQKNHTELQALHCLMSLIPELASDALGSEKYKLCWQTTLDSFQDPVINRHLVYCLLDLLLEALLPELPEKDFQRRLMNTLSGNPEKMLA